MARPEKPGVDYFPLDTTWETNMKLVKARFKLTGVGCIVELWKEVYRQGYAMTWDPDTQLLFASENGIEIEQLQAIVAFAADRGIFDARMLQNQGLLTSHGIQKRWKRIVKESGRKTTQIPDYLDLTTSEEFPPQETTFPSQETEFPVPESTQSKVKKSKVNVLEHKAAHASEPAPQEHTLGNLEVPQNLTFSDQEKAALFRRVGPSAQDHLNKLSRLFDAYGYGGKYPNHWAALRGFWENSGGPVGWLESGPGGKPEEGGRAETRLPPKPIELVGDEMTPEQLEAELLEHPIVVGRQQIGVG